MNACVESCDFLSNYLNLDHGQRYNCSECKTISGEYTHTSTFYDSFVPESYYNPNQSINTSGFNIGQFSEVYIQSNETLSSLCVKELTDSAYTCVANSSSFLWDVPQTNSSGILTLEVVAVDAFNNTRTDLLDFNYHHAAPYLYQNYYTSTTNGTILLNYSSQFDTIISTDGDYSQVSSDGYLYSVHQSSHIQLFSSDELGNTNIQMLQYNMTLHQV